MISTQGLLPPRDTVLKNDFKGKASTATITFVEHPPTGPPGFFSHSQFTKKKLSVPPPDHVESGMCHGVGVASKTLTVLAPLDETKLISDIASLRQ